MSGRLVGSMIIETLLENSNVSGYDPSGLMFIELGIPEEFYPSIISSSRGSFLISRRQHKNGSIRIGVFNSYGDVDKFIPDMIRKSYQLSTSENYGNIFYGHEKCYDYIKSNLETDEYPSSVLVPGSWDLKKIKSYFGSRNISKSGDLFIYKKHTNVVKVDDLPLVVFCSRPDYCGLLHTFTGGMRSIILHNVERGFSFVSP